MKKKTFLLLGVLFGISAFSAHAETVSLSGTVYDKTGNDLFGVAVSLASGGLSTITSTSGVWVLSGDITSGIRNRNTPSQAITSHLSVQDGHVLLNYSGSDLLGRSRHAAGLSLSSGSAASARASSMIIDTLYFSWNDSVRVRLPLTSYVQSGLATIVDTSSSRSSSVSGDTGYFTDSRDGQSYKYVKIGSQRWMAQNLNYKTDSSWCYADSSANCIKYGRLYQWAAAMGLSSTYNSTLWHGADSAQHQGICPSGWHVPSDTEWGVLLTYVGMDSARIKLSSTSSWNTTYYKGTNAYGFNVLPAGDRDHGGGAFYNLGDDAYFWSSSEIAASDAWDRIFYYANAYVYRRDDSKSNGFSLRCLQN